MKRYIGTKEVKARPMTAGTAEGMGFRTNKYFGPDEGYIVEYADGYKSWSPKKVFEQAYKLCETHIDRIKIEHDELLDKYNKLVLFLGREDAVDIVGEAQFRLMNSQMYAMKEYLTILYRRMEELNTDQH